MIRSMTGFGRGSCEAEGRSLTVELRSVNHRFLDPGIRLPKQIGFLEEILRAELARRIARGHVDVFVSYRNNRQDAKRIEIDGALLRAYLMAARQAAEETGLPDNITLTDALRLPDVATIVQANEDKDEVAALLRAALGEAMDGLLAMREAEGRRLLEDLARRLAAVYALAERIAQRAPLVPKEYKDKLLERLAELSPETEMDQTRLATEIALYADRCCVDEETVRIFSHLKQFDELIRSDEAAGRKMDFLVQELNREFNTVGSKSGDMVLTNAVLEGKGEIEKIREQVQNIE